MKEYNIILSGHDQVCCRSNSFRNLQLLDLVYREFKITNNDVINIFVHPSEWSILYRFHLLLKFGIKRYHSSFQIDLISKSSIVIARMSTVLLEIETSSLDRAILFDPDLHVSYIRKFPIFDEWEIIANGE